MSIPALGAVMTEEKKINQSMLRVVKGDITDTEVEAFVYYATTDLQLGSGFGNAIAIRGGQSIQKELEQFGTVETGESVITAAGKLKSKYIVHAVGPKFQEENLEAKLKTTIVNALKRAEEKGIEQIAFPPMGVGFYGVPLDESAGITLGTIKEYLAGDTKLREVMVVANDAREYKPFETRLRALS
jgi:O-acetyl-ADP-ribose deacetylase (regulator of RNase III)